MKIEYPDNFSLDELNETFLWRYVELHKLFDLIENEQIYFTRLDKFEDGIEGITGKGVLLKAIIQGSPLTIENINPAFDENEQKKIIDNDKTQREKYLTSLSDSQQTQFASCWFLGTRESIAMWKLYSKKDGVAIKFSARELADTLISAAKSYTNSDFSIFAFGHVDYKNIWPFDSHEKFNGKFNALKKDKSYIHENEFRFISVVPVSAKGKYEYYKLPIGKLNTYKLEIITNPYMSDWQRTNLQKVLEKYGLEKSIRHSQIEIRK